jgi:hypothetical protein
MPPLRTLMLLACAPIVVGYLAWRHQFPKSVTTHDQQEATNGQGERPMTSGVAGPEGERVLRWMDDAPAVFEGVRQLLRERSLFTVVAEAAQTERDRLQQQCEALRQEVRRLQAETERVHTERAETAQWLSSMIKEAASRFRIEPPPA